MQIQQDQEKKFQVAGAGAAGVGSALVLGQPVMAQSTGAVADITSMVTSLGTLAGVITTVILGAMVVRLGIKFVNRMSVKG